MLNISIPVSANSDTCNRKNFTFWVNEVLYSYESSPRSIRTNKENTRNLEILKHRFKRYFRQTTRGFCITIMRRLTLHSFFATISPKTQRISFHNHHIRLIWLHGTSGYSPNSKDHSEDSVLTRLKRYKPNRRRL